MESLFACSHRVIDVVKEFLLSPDISIGSKSYRETLIKVKRIKPNTLENPVPLYLPSRQYRNY